MQLLVRILGLLLGAALMVLAFLFSLLLLAVLLGVALVALGYFLWKSRTQRARGVEGAQPPSATQREAGTGQVIEGESRRVADDREPNGPG